MPIAGLTVRQRTTWPKHARVQWESVEVESNPIARGPGVADEREETLEPARQWMKNTMLRIRNKLEPKIEELFNNLEQ